MAAKPKSHPLNGMHTAGIFSDMSIDGPEIGTLVLVVDRAKNLPNRKTIGKQDPYCAARLGKEARKTTTDIRGGQTPKWDQELRFVVHDSPDYYQLKVSVFNDDKKTDLIGESWIDLRDIVVSGGGQSDQWHNLSCRGKYAGEIRIEITYYDSRPKPEKPLVVKAKQASGPEAESPGGPRAAPKRRPLPTEPAMGPSPPAAGQDYNQAPQRPQPIPPSSYIPNQSPLQAVEYNTTLPAPAPAPARYQQEDHYSPGPPSGGYGTPTHRVEAPPPPHHRTPDRHDMYPVHPDEQDYSPNFNSQPFDRHEPQSPYPSRLEPLDLPTIPDDDRPPPPPVHRSRNNSGNANEMANRASYELTTQKGTPPTMRHGVLRSEAHRHSVPSHYSGRPSYKAYDSAPAAPQSSQYGGDEPHQPSPPRHHSYDSSFDPAYRSMQPSVEDVPDSPSPLSHSLRTSGSRMPQYDHQSGYDTVPSPAPLNLGGRGSAASGHYSGSTLSIPHRHHDSNEYAPSVSSMSSRDHISSRDTVSPTQSSYPSYGSSHSQQLTSYRSELDDTQVRNSNNYGLPPVPPSLVPGVDPTLAQEISDRINDERRHERRYTQQMFTPPRGRPPNDIPPNYGPDSSPAAYGTPQQTHGRSPVTYSEGPTSPNIVKPQSVSPNPNFNQSPNPNHTIKRKSISPAPPPSEDRRLSGVPFGPDSYDALNPSVASSKSADHRPDYNEASGKIITHDGREVDPSDHLPMDTWAPEPEPKPAKPPSARPSPAGAQPMPPSSGRRPLRVAAGRPQSLATPPQAQYIAPDPTPETPSPPASTGRNRLQKKVHRASAMPILPSPSPPPVSSASGPAQGSSPLAPLAHPRMQDNFTPPRQMHRASTWDYPNENMAPRGHGYAGPPVPAKVPLPLSSSGRDISGQGAVPMMSGALQVSVRGRGGSDGGGGRRGGEDWALMEEMSRIDIGTGRARRHHGGY